MWRKKGRFEVLDEKLLDSIIAKTETKERIVKRHTDIELKWNTIQKQKQELLESPHFVKMKELYTTQKHGNQVVASSQNKSASPEKSLKVGSLERYPKVFSKEGSSVSRSDERIELTYKTTTFLPHIGLHRDVSINGENKKQISQIKHLLLKKVRHKYKDVKVMLGDVQFKMVLSIPDEPISTQKETPLGETVSGNTQSTDDEFVIKVTPERSRKVEQIQHVKEEYTYESNKEGTHRVYGAKDKFNLGKEGLNIEQRISNSKSQISNHGPQFKAQLNISNIKPHISNYKPKGHILSENNNITEIEISNDSYKIDGVKGIIGPVIPKENISSYRKNAKINLSSHGNIFQRPRMLTRNRVVRDTPPQKYTQHITRDEYKLQSVHQNGALSTRKIEDIKKNNDNTNLKESQKMKQLSVTGRYVLKHQIKDNLKTMNNASKRTGDTQVGFVRQNTAFTGSSSSKIIVNQQIDYSKMESSTHLRVTEPISMKTYLLKSDTNLISSYSKFSTALKHSASKEKVVILSIFDESFADFVINFYETSLNKLGIHNFLFVSMSHDGCFKLIKLGIPCFYDGSVDLKAEGRKPQKYGEHLFWKKVNSRHIFIYHALKWRYTVFHLDPDVIFFKNPFLYFTCKSCDLIGMRDGPGDFLNIGTVLLKPTYDTLQLYKEFIYHIETVPTLNEQGTFNTLLELFRERTTFKVGFISTDIFVNGQIYFDKGKRYFAGEYPPCNTCALVHNNCLLTKAAKIYRFKENQMWVYDINGYYYNPKTKYLVYDNPMNYKNTTLTYGLEQTALRSAMAIGKMLNRKVILPKFHCEHKHCPFNSYYMVEDFDREFENDYREHTFLIHPKVPESTKKNISPLVTIHSALSIYMNATLWRKGGLHYKTKGAVGTTSDALISALMPFEKYSVLKIHSLYGAFYSFSDNTMDIFFRNKWTKALKKATYEQNPI